MISAIRICCALVFAILCFQANANVKLPTVFNNDMVLQRDKPCRIWGWADKNESITVSFNGQKIKTKAGRNGSWEVVLKAMPAGGPYELLVAGKNQIKLTNILLGDVYVCGGQSNMEWPLRTTRDAEKEIQQSDYPQIRLLTVPRARSFMPAVDLDGGEWKLCGPSTVGDFSAVAYFFGRKLHLDNNVPIGLISSNWGGTNIQAWLSWDYMGQMDAYKSADLNALEADKKQADDKMKQFQDLLKKDRGVAESWYKPDFSFGQKTIKVPGFWEATEIGNADGVIWFRKEFEVTDAMRSQAGKLSLGPIDDNDITWINGQILGKTNGYNIDREYEVPVGILKTGTNVIVVKVTDGTGGGGFYGKENQLYLQAGKEKVSLAGNWNYRVEAITTDFGVRDTGPNAFPSQLFNAMIAPLTPLAIKGVIWYQGEANVSDPAGYRILFPAMIRDWRAKWGDEFPFMWVQLANYLAPKPEPVESGWAALREAQNLTLEVPKTAQAVIIDIGEANDIHPRNKQDVGYRLALGAEKIVYGKDIVFSGPVYESMKIEGNRILLTFSNTGTGLVAHDKYGYLRGFAIAGNDGHFEWAQARISGNQVIVESEKISNPVAVRYAWADNPDDANLYNKEGLPASPFRTGK